MEVLFTSLQSLPDLPPEIHQLMSAIDGGEASAAQLESIIVGDNGLSTSLLRVANAAQPNLGPAPASIRSAVMILGQVTVRNLAVSLLVQRTIGSRATAEEFPAIAHRRHSVLTAYLARYIFARRRMKGQVTGSWSVDQVFSAALLHDVGLSLLASLTPDVYRAVARVGHTFNISLEEAFQLTFEVSLNDLTSRAIDTWGLPTAFAETIQHYQRPWEFWSQLTPLCCIHYADYLANVLGGTIESWPLSLQLPPEVEAEVGLDTEEVAILVELVSEQVVHHFAEIDQMAA